MNYENQNEEASLYIENNEQQSFDFDTHLDALRHMVRLNPIAYAKVQKARKQAEKLRAVKGTITAESIDSIINSKLKPKVIKFTGRLNNEITKKYKSKFANDKEFSELIDFLLEEYYKKMSY